MYVIYTVNHKSNESLDNFLFILKQVVKFTFKLILPISFSI